MNNKEEEIKVAMKKSLPTINQTEGNQKERIPKKKI